MLKRVVYSQAELDKAIADGVRAITLCSGFFDVSKTYDICFDRIGPVKVKVNSTRAEAETAGMRFEGIYPEYRQGYGVESRESMAVVAAISSGSGSSFASYGSGSYGSYGSYGSGSSGSGTNYYEYEYEFEYRSSMCGSIHGSMGTSFRLHDSCGYRDITKTVGYEDERRTIHVYGYGINLI